MLYYNFENFEEFKELFGIVNHGNGAKNRKNKILLAYIKNKELLHEARVTNDYTLLHISSMSELKQKMKERIIESGKDKKYKVQLINDTYHSDLYETDNRSGICEDGDIKSIRYINKNNGKTYKMKASKLLHNLIEESEFGKKLPDQVKNWLCEEFSQDWQAYSMGVLPKNQLVVSDEFQKIYSQSACEGNFGSCMTNRNRHYFYEDAVNASAAYLTNESGKIIARCIIFNEVWDQDCKVWRLAERQYSTDSNDVLKRALVDALIRGGYIDGYKKVGAGCHQANEFVDNEGNSLSDKEFRIDCDLDSYDTLSYQDSFKYYDIRKRVAYNFPEDEAYYNLDTTDLNLEGDDDEEDNYDDYHDCYTANETVTVLVDGREMECDEDRLDDFRWVDRLDMYVYYEDTSFCEVCQENYLSDDGVYSEITEEYYCCESCKAKAEQKYKEQNWFFCEYNNDYVEDEADVTELYQWNTKIRDYVAISISKAKLTELVTMNRCFIIGDEAYDKLNGRTNLPFHYKKRVVA